MFDLLPWDICCGLMLVDVDAVLKKTDEEAVRGGRAHLET